MKTLKFQEDNLVALIPSNHPLAVKDSIDLIALQNEDFIIGNTQKWIPFYKILQHDCKMAGFEPNITIEASSSEEILGYVSAGCGVSLYAETAKNFYRHGVKVLKINDKLPAITTEVIISKEKGNPINIIFYRLLRN
jgi:DNA-binding transcriptional LysR family regulator